MSKRRRPGLVAVMLATIWLAGLAAWIALNFPNPAIFALGYVAGLCHVLACCRAERDELGVERVAHKRALKLIESGHVQATHKKGVDEMREIARRGLRGELPPYGPAA